MGPLTNMLKVLALQPYDELLKNQSEIKGERGSRGKTRHEMKLLMHNMLSSLVQETQALELQNGNCCSDSELKELEKGVNDLVLKIKHYRATLPDQLKTTADLVLAAAHRPLPLLQSGSEHDSSVNPNPEVLLTEEDAEKLQLLKQKISTNVSTMPFVQQRINECISRIDKLASNNLILHPAFTRKND